MIKIEDFKKKLREYSSKDIVVTGHADIRALARGIDLEEVKRNICNPEKLVYVEKQDSRKDNLKRYGCYFAYSENYCHKYVIVLNGKVIIVTIININRNWQKVIGK
jgi:hypothetical protein